MSPQRRATIKQLVDVRSRERARREGMLIREIDNRIRGVGDRVCEWCGITFYARHPATRFCCGDHRDRAWRRTDACKNINREHKARQRLRRVAA